jgi:hypothetical protein
VTTNKRLKSRLAKLEAAKASRRVRYVVASRPLASEEMTSGTYQDDEENHRPMTEEEWAAESGAEVME